MARSASLHESEVCVCMLAEMLPDHDVRTFRKFKMTARTAASQQDKS